MNLGVFELLLLVTVFVLISCNALPPVTPIGLAGWFHAVGLHPLMVRADVWDASGRDLLSKSFLVLIWTCTFVHNVLYIAY